MKLRKKWSRQFRNWRERFRVPRLLTIDFYWKLACIPFSYCHQQWKHRRFRDLVYGIPGLLSLIAIVVVAVMIRLKSDGLADRYLSEAAIAIESKQFAKGELLISSVLRRFGTRTNEAQFQMAVLLDEAGQKERAQAIFHRLAPDDAVGRREAHRRLAAILAAKITRQSAPEELKKLLWHLTCAKDETSPEMTVAWSQYLLAVGDIAGAKRFLELAVKSFPELWQTLGLVSLSQGETASAIASFVRSADFLQEKLKEDPNNWTVRIDYAQVLIRLGRLEESRLVLEQGKNLNPEQPWNKMLATLAVAYYDLNLSEGKPISELLTYLDRALSYDPNHGQALNRLMSYASANVSGNGDLRTILSRVIAEGEQPALAHLAMGNLCWIEKDKKSALFHYERAISLRGDALVLLNNLAWALAHETPPDLDRALALVTTALKDDPNNKSFLDTRGTIYFLQKNWEPALTDLEIALSGVKNKKAVHAKLAVVYEELGQPEIAKQHRILAEQSASAESISPTLESHALP